MQARCDGGVASSIRGNNLKVAIEVSGAKDCGLKFFALGVLAS